jgi:hypothetical protein
LLRETVYPLNGRRGNPFRYFLTVASENGTSFALNLGCLTIFAKSLYASKPNFKNIYN